jgi:hypothetical protein
MIKLGTATSSPPMNALSLDLAHDTTIGWSPSQTTISIAGTVDNVPFAIIIIPPTRLEMIITAFDTLMVGKDSDKVNHPATSITNVFKPFG